MNEPAALSIAELNDLPLSQSLDGWLANARNHIGELYLRAQEDICPPSFDERIENSRQWRAIVNTANTNNANSPGFSVYHKINEVLDQFRHPDGSLIKRSPDQRNFHRHMLKACLPKIFAGEWHQSSNTIIQKLGLQNEPIHSQVIISTPRRYGKTWAVSMFVAACLYCIPGFSLIIYSVADRQSQMMMETVVRMFDTLPGGKIRHVKKNSEFFIVTDDRGTTAQLQCLPGSSATTRGVGGDLIILEEAGFMKEQIWYENIVPLLGVNDTALIGISTPPEEMGNYYLRLFDCKDEEGHDIFETIKVELQCADCIEKRATRCPHKVIQPPAWKSEKRRMMQEAIYANHPLYYLREVLGIPIPSDIHVFAGHAVDEFISPAFLPMSPTTALLPDPMGPERAKFVFIGIDPCGGGTQSDTSFCALSFRASDGHPVVSRLLLLGGGGVTVVVTSSVSSVVLILRLGRGRALYS